MEELLQKHRQEQKDLQGRITQKKKQATKKTRKGVNDECADLERQLKQRQAAEAAALRPKDVTHTDSESESESDGEVEVEVQDSAATESAYNLNASMNVLSISPPTSDGNVKKPNRQKARLARRAAEQQAAVEEARLEAQNIPDLREQERHSMREAYQPKGLKEQEIRSDGHCLYAAVADQLQDHGLGLAPTSSKLEIPEFAKSPATLRYSSTRQVAASYIAQHPEDFQPFIEGPLDAYVNQIRNTGEWGGHLEIQALSKAYGIDINVLQANGRVETIESGEASEKPLWLAYYHHSYGLGEHYNSLREAEP